MRLCIVPRKVYAQTAPPKLVCMLAKGSMHELSRSAALDLVKLHEILHEAGYTLRTFHLGPTDIGPSIRRIRQLVQENPASCWVVRSGNASIQKFFDGCGIPTFLIAYAGEGISLPFLHVKDAASCQHAVGKLHALGHSKIALLVDDTPTHTHSQLCKAFDAAMRQASGTSIPLVIRYSPLRENIWQRLTEVFHNTDTDPTALITQNVFEAVSVLSFFSHHKIEMPGHVSLVCLHYNPMLSYWKPEISAYNFNQVDFNTETAQLIIRLAKVGELPKTDYSVLAGYRGGQTMVPPRDTVSRKL